MVSWFLMPLNPITPRKLMDVTKLNKLGWKATIDLEKGIRKVYEEIKNTNWN